MTLKSTFSIACALAATSSVMAAIPAVSPVPADLSLRMTASVNVLDSKSLRNSTESSIATRAGEVTEVITQPEGRVQETMTTGTGYYMFAGMQFPYYGDTVATKLVYGEDGDIYFYNILPYGATNTYVKGKIEGDKVILPLPQTVSYNYEEDFGINLDILEYYETEKYWTYIPAKDKHSVEFTIGEDESLTLEELAENLQLGYVYSDNDEYLGYGATALYIEYFNEKLVEVPESAEIQSWSIIKGDTGGKVDIAFDGDDVYIGGIFYVTLPDAWIKGHIVEENGKKYVAIPNKQYLGMDTNVFCYLYFMTQAVETEDDYIEPEFLDLDYEYMFTFDEEGRVLIPVEPDIMLVANLSDEYYYSAEELTNPIIRYQDSFAGTPANPYELTFLKTDFGQNGFIFYVPSVSTENTALDTKCLYYEVFVNDEIFEFTKNEYYLQEDMSRVPYNFDNDFISNYGGSCRWIWFSSALEISNISVQLIYDYEDVETYSDLITLDLTQSNVDNIEEGLSVVSEQYFDLYGRCIANPSQGLYIVKRTFSDGSVRSHKMIRSL